MMRSDSDNICREFEKCGSIKGTAKSCRVSVYRVRKVLSTQGYVLNENHRLILNYHEEHFTSFEISRLTGLSVNVVRSYLPAVRPFYKENLSDNAKRIRACRERKRIKK